MSTTLVVVIGLAWLITGITGLAILAIAHDANRWDRIMARDTSARCRACIAENPDEDCSECGWREVE